jgi:hypothetical protein
MKTMQTWNRLLLSAAFGALVVTPAQGQLAPSRARVLVDYTAVRGGVMRSLTIRADGSATVVQQAAGARSVVTGALAAGELAKVRLVIDRGAHAAIVDAATVRPILPGLGTGTLIDFPNRHGGGVTLLDGGAKAMLDAIAARILRGGMPAIVEAPTEEPAQEEQQQEEEEEPQVLPPPGPTPPSTGLPKLPSR